MNGENYIKQNFILIVEDEIKIATKLKKFLTELGYITEIINKNKDIFTYINKNHPDLILIDISLEDSTKSIDIAEKLYKNNYDIPLIYLISKSDSKKIKDKKFPNIYDYLVKPVNIDFLDTTINMVLDKYKLEKELKIKIKELEQTNVELEESHQELEQANEELEKSYQELEETNIQLERFRLMTKNSYDMMGILDEKGNILVESDSVERILGYTVDEVMGINAFELTHPDDIEMLQSKFEEIIQNPEQYIVMEHRNRHKNGYWVYLETSGKNMLHDPEIRGIVINSRDITEKKKAEKELKEELNFRKTLLETITNPIFYKNTDGIYIDCNKAFVNYLKLSYEEIIEKSVYDVAPKELADKYYKMDNELIRNKDKQRYESKVIDSKGNEKYVIFNKVCVLDDNGEPKGIVGVISDITEIKAFEKKLIESEEKFRTLFENANDAIFVAEAKTGVIINVNKRAAKLIGYPKNEIIGMYQSQLHPSAIKDDVEETFKSFSKMKKIEGNFGETIIQHRNGYVIPVEISTSSCELNGKIILYGIFRDITERKKREKELKESEAKYRALAENNKDFILRFDRDFRHIYVNKSAEKVSDLTYEQYMLKTIGEIGIFSDEVVKLCENTLKHAFESGKEQSVQFYITISNQNKIFLDWRAFPEINPEGNVDTVLVVARDITYTKEIEDRLNKYVNKLETMNKELENFTYTVSHDLKSSLSNIISAMRIIHSRNAIKTEEEKDLLTEAIEIAYDISNFITDLLSYSSLTNERSFEYLDLNNIIPDIKDKDVEIHCDDLPIIKGSKTMLMTLFQNLIDNSIKYSSEKRKTIIHIKSYEKENEWLFSITDNGIGVRMEDKENIFQMLYRAKEVKENYEGTGIGLASCRKVIELHGGEIWLESELGKGTTFYFTIPKM